MFLRSEIILYSNFIFFKESKLRFFRFLLRFAVFFVCGVLFFLPFLSYIRFIFLKTTAKKQNYISGGSCSGGGSLLHLYYVKRIC